MPRRERFAAAEIRLRAATHSCPHAHSLLGPLGERGLSSVRVTDAFLPPQNLKR